MILEGKLVKKALTLTILSASILLLIGLPTAGQELMPFIDGVVTSVTDGDSFAIKSDQGKTFHVRLHGVAAPEKQQPFGAESHRKLSAKLLGKTVRVYFKLTDTLARALGKVIIDDEDVGFEQINSGLAWYYTLYINELSDDDRLTYSQAFDEAKKLGKGLWRDPRPVSPWAYCKANNINEIDQVVPDPPKAKPTAAAVLGNSRTKLFFKANCVGYKSIPASLRVTFTGASAAEEAGYKIAKGCR